ncbi:H-NS family nucleoid-associated regulatory protein, partial [Acinetobacter baumannii]|uniref:H-NS histone family protein n=1 Tax=Acinetobacter baumannii TaxID=470 RepID=UPI001D172C12
SSLENNYYDIISMSYLFLSCTESVEPRYRNKNNAEETWTGRGKQPRWLVAEIEKGAKLEDFLI